MSAVQNISFPQTGMTTTDIVSFQGRPTGIVQNIMDQMVAENSKIAYRNSNTLFILWLYNKEDLREEVLQDWMVEKLHIAANDDLLCNNRKQTEMRRVCYEALEAINRADNNCPIILSKINFNIFSDYVSTRKNKNGSVLSKASYCGI